MSADVTLTEDEREALGRAMAHDAFHKPGVVTIEAIHRAVERILADRLAQVTAKCSYCLARKETP